MPGLAHAGERNQYELLFEHAPVAIWLEDFSAIYDYLVRVAQGRAIPDLLQDRSVVVECIRRVRIIHVNLRAREFYGAQTSEDLTSHFEDLFDDASIEVFRQELLAFHSGSQRFDADVMATTLGGEERLVRMNCALAPSPLNNPWSFLVVTFTDLDERRALEQDLRASERRAHDYARNLAMLNKDLESFAYAAAHDLREPLRTVSLYAQLLRHSQPETANERTAAAIQFILSNTERMQQLITDLLGFAQSAGDHRNGSNAACDANSVAHEVLLSLAAAIRDSGAEIQIGPVPLLAVEPGHMRQLLQNLIGNAIKYRQAGRPLLIRVSAEASRPGRVILTVSDNGQGIRPEYQERIFNIFHRLHGPEIAGSGIGLALCARIAGIYNGSINVESDGTSGSAFHVDLPAAGHSSDEV